MGLKDVYEDLKFKAIAKKEAINEWYASEKVQKRISKVKAKLQLAKEQAKKYAAEIEKNEQFLFCCIDQSDALLRHIKTKWGWKTVPLIVEKNTTNEAAKFIGGFTDLQKYLEEK